MVASTVRHPIKLGDKEYQVSPIDDSGREALDEWVRAKYVERISPLINAMKSEADKILAIDRAFAQASKMTWLSGEGAQMMGTVEGVARLLYEGIRKNHPEVTIEDFRAELFNSENIMKANAVFRELNTNRVKREAAAAEKSPGKRRRSPRKKST